MTGEEIFYHRPVLCNEALDSLVTDPGGIYIDGTLGGGGHSEALLRRLSASGRVIAFDVDEDAIEHARRLADIHGARFVVVRENFRNIGAVLHSMAVEAVAGILLDLGLSSHHIDDRSRGFSFQSPSALDMRMDRGLERTAADVIAAYDEKELADIFWKYGEEKSSRKIARAVVKARGHEGIKTTTELYNVILSVVGGRFAVKSAARVFQALRIEVNGELNALEEALAQMPELLQSGGRVVVIAYHSLEDRIVKNFFRTESATTIKAVHRLLPDSPRHARLRLLVKNPITPGAEEVEQNPRARSAKMRAAERL